MDRIGRYKIVRELGRGAMGVVYHAIDPNIGRPVAIKTIQFSAVRKPEEQERLRERLFREARSAGMLSHPGIVTIYDVEQQGDLAYIAMEYVDGPTLDQLLSEPEALGQEQMFSVLGQTAVALDYAHLKGIVHRDIKPANIMIAADGTAKITDFGIAKITASENLTMTGSIVGTPHYMSPEQVQGKQVDGRSDQFSLAVIAYEMLTGEKPYTGEHLTTVVYKIVAEEPVSPRRLNPGLSAAIEAALSKAMSKKPEARYRNCQEFIAALESAGNASKAWKPMPRGGSLNEPTMVDAPVDARRPAVVLPPPRRAARTGESTTTALADKKRRSGFVPFLVGMLCVAALLVAMGLLISKKTPVSQTLPANESKEDQPKSQPAPAATTPTSAATPEASAKDKPSPLGAATGTATSAGTGAGAGKSPETPTVTQPDQTAGAAPPGPVVQSPPAEPRPTPRNPKETTKETAKDTPKDIGPAPHRPPLRNAAAPQDILVTSSPAGATATLDGNPAAACTTPCSLSAAPGNHTIAVTMVGYQIEHRYVAVGSAPLELPPVVLRASGGTLMLTSDPAGATVLVNGRQIPQVTPVQIPLSLGTYTVTVEKDGRQVTEKVEVHNGINYRKILLGQ
ncbi:MAG TPA: protein kinase [Candidatus Acidoferrales bacterium]|nr:protein kinase [Candidatus Acidoferrales bacterium]